MLAEQVWVPPRVEHYPQGDASKALAALEFGKQHGFELDAHQEHVFVNAMRTRQDGKWAASEVGWVEPRQNGKTETLLLRDLAGLFVFGEQLIIHSAHRLDTAEDAFHRIVGIIQDSDSLRGQVAKFIRTNGKYGIQLHSGAEIKFRSRSTGGGLGFSGDLVIFDEAMFLAESFLGALMPTLSARSVHGNPQQWFVGSAVDQWIHENGVVFSRVRERGIDGAGRSAYFEWSAPFDVTLNEVTREMVEDRSWWPKANPAFGTRIAEEWIEQELLMNTRTFANMRGSVGDWPRTDELEETVISVNDWMGLIADGTMVEPLTVAFDVDHDRRTAVALAGRRPDGLFQVEIPEYKNGTGWLVDYLAGLLERRQVSVVVCDGYGSVSLVKACEDAGVDVETTTAPELAQACGRLVDAVNERLFRHLGSDELLNAIRGSKARPLGDAWAWSRKNSSVGIAPLVAATLALSAAMDQPEGEVRIW